MAGLKYWDEAQGAWFQVGGGTLGAGQGYVPLSGGTIDGSLVVDVGETWEVQVVSPGTIAAEGITTTSEGVFNGNILLSAGRTVALGGARVQNVGDPTAGSGAATKQYVDTLYKQVATGGEPALGEGWAAFGEPYGAPSYRLSGNLRTVLLAGVVRATAAMTPEPHSSTIFTLPEGCRPPVAIRLMTVGNGGAMFLLHVEPNGAVRLGYGPYLLEGGWVSLDGCGFLTA